jgi:hypothetical protein
MTIAATRMHRSLIDFTSGSAEVYDILRLLSYFHAQCGLCCFRSHETQIRPLTSLVFSKTKRTDRASTTQDQIKVSVNRASEQFSTSSEEGDRPLARSSARAEKYLKSLATQKASNAVPNASSVSHNFNLNIEARQRRGKKNPLSRTCPVDVHVSRVVNELLLQ